MRVQGFQQDGNWTKFGFTTTYRNGWDKCLAFTSVIFNYTIHPEIMTAANTKEPLQISSIDEIWKIPESRFIIIRGMNKVYDNAPFQHIFFNQTDQVQIEMPSEYLNSLKNSPTELLSNEEKKYIFDKYMDSIEVNGEGEYCKYVFKNDIKALLTAITDLKEFDGNYVYRNNYTKTDVNISDICKKVIANYNKE